MECQASPHRRRKTTELDRLQPFCWDKQRDKYPANLEKLAVPTPKRLRPAAGTPQRLTRAATTSPSPSHQVEETHQHNLQQQQQAASDAHTLSGGAGPFPAAAAGSGDGAPAPTTEQALAEHINNNQDLELYDSPAGDALGSRFDAVADDQPQEEEVQDGAAEEEEEAAAQWQEPQQQQLQQNQQQNQQAIPEGWNNLPPLYPFTISALHRFLSAVPDISQRDVGSFAAALLAADDTRRHEHMELLEMFGAAKQFEAIQEYIKQTVARHS